MNSKSKNILEELYQSFESDSDDEDYVCKDEGSCYVNKSNKFSSKICIIIIPSRS